MGCTGCKKKTYYNNFKKIDKKIKTTVFSVAIIILLSIYGIYSLISKLW